MKAAVLPLAVCSVLVLAGCDRAPKQVHAAPATAVPVTTLTVAETEIPAVYAVSGTVRARTVSPLSSKVMAYVRSVGVREGDRVEAGQVLVTLDSEDLDARYKRAESGRQEMVSALPEAESAVSEAKANLDLAEATFRRMQDLYTKGSISNQEFDEATAKVEGRARRLRNGFRSTSADARQDCSNRSGIAQRGH